MPWRRRASPGSGKEAERKRQLLEGELAMMAAGATTEEVDEMVAARAAMDVTRALTRVELALARQEARLAAVAAELGGVQFHLAGEIGLPTATTFWSVEHLDPAVRAKNQQVVRAVAAVMKSHPELRLVVVIFRDGDGRVASEGRDLGVVARRRAALLLLLVVVAVRVGVAGGCKVVGRVVEIGRAHV